MKRHSLFILLVSFCFFANSQPAIQWQQALGGTLNDVPLMMLKTADGGFILGGSSESKDGDVKGAHGNYDIWVVKLGGTSQWKKTYGG